jgi:post-segregation antitoxin (ccd killing protein)
MPRVSDDRRISTKKSVNLSIDSGVLSRVRDQDRNLSGTVRHALRSF